MPRKRLKQFEVTFSKYSIIADGIDEIVLENIPIGTEVTVNAVTYYLTVTTIRIISTEPGKVTITLNNKQYYQQIMVFYAH